VPDCRGSTCEYLIKALVGSHHAKVHETLLYSMACERRAGQQVVADPREKRGRLPLPSGNICGKRVTIPGPGVGFGIYPSSAGNLVIVEEDTTEVGRTVVAVDI
jgi:hypothetical protein